MDQTSPERGIHESLGPGAKSFVSWMNRNNFDIHPNVQLRYVNSYQGHSVIASGPIEEEAKLFQVPKQCTLSWKTSTLKKRMPKLKLPGWNALILAMMFEDSQPDSHWRSYLDILPKSLNTPVFWTPSQLELLKGASIEDHIGAAKIKKDYEKVIVPLLGRAEFYTVPPEQRDAIKANFFSLEQYMRFGSLIMAYSFTFDDGDIAMVPMADMLNHKTGHNNARLYFDQEDDTLGDADVKAKTAEEGQKPSKKAKVSENTFLHMRTRRLVNAEEELYNTYGTLSDSELLRKYGYVEDEGKNRWNEVEIPVSLLLAKCAESCGWDATEVKKRKDFIKKQNLVDPDNALLFFMPQESFGPFDPTEVEDAVDGGLTRDIVALAKIFAATPSDWAEAEKAILEAKKNKPKPKEDDEDDDDDEMESDDEDHHDHHGHDHKEGEVCNHKHHEAATSTDTALPTEPPAQPATEQKKSGGDLIVVQDKAKLRDIVLSVIQARIDKYGPNCSAVSTEQLSALPPPGSENSNDDTLRARGALLLKLGELKILENLQREARLLCPE